MKKIRIGCGSAFWGDTSTAAEQLVHKGQIDYLVFDYLAETTLSIMAAERAKDPEAGYARDFVEQVFVPLLSHLKVRGIKVVANAGGANPLACKKALEAAAARAGFKFKVAAVLGDDLQPRKAAFEALTEMETGEPLPSALTSMNAYLGAIPIAKALRSGADIVLTGRCVDSALALGPLIHEFGWKDDDYDRLAAGSVAGHLLEAGTQCTGGNFTDWDLVRAGYADMGFPIAECDADGGLVITKPEGTGGLVSVHTVLEQLLHGIGDPRALFMPDVVVDLTQVRLEQAGEHRVKVSGAKGQAPTAFYKLGATYTSGARCAALFIISGIDAVKKGRVSADAAVEKVRRLLRERGFEDFTGVDIHCIGTEESYGPNAREGARSTREAAVKIAVHHRDPRAVELFAQEISQAATAMAPGFTESFGGLAPQPVPIPHLFSALVPKDQVPIELVIGEQVVPVSVPVNGGFVAPPREPVEDPGPPAILEGTVIQVPLYRLALARSGHKGDHANIGVIARQKLYLPYLRQVLRPRSVRRHFAHVLAGGEQGRVDRWELPGSMSFNFLLYNALDGGGACSLRTDPHGRAFGQMLLDFPVTIPALLASSI
jgi:hypothetical protein